MIRLISWESVLVWLGLGGRRRVELRGRETGDVQQKEEQRWYLYVKERAEAESEPLSGCSWSGSWVGDAAKVREMEGCKVEVEKSRRSSRFQLTTEKGQRQQCVGGSREDEDEWVRA